jgi:crotonobetainyl-CoA:carnitine CoA-transferase CaiB-like acyl-CoA transferase
MTALTEIMHIVVAQLAGDWSPEQRERVQRAIANFKIVNQGLGSIVPSGNPVTKAELERLRQYTQRAELGEPFSPEEARDFKELAEKATKDYASAEWASELLKVALFVFALYALSELLKPQKKAS